MLFYYLRMRRVNWSQFYRNFDISERCRLIAHPITTTAVCGKEYLNKTSILKLNSGSFRNEKQKYEDTFGNISSFENTFMKIKDDPEDVKDYKRNKAAKGKKIPEYIKEISHHLQNRDYKSALRVLEVDMYNDKKPPVAWIYTDMIMYNAKIGNLEEAYRLYTNFKKFGGKPSGALYTAMFAACQRCKDTDLALKAATAVREFLINDKRQKPNSTHYRAMILAFGKSRDLATCFKIFDEIIYKRDKVAVLDFQVMFNAFLNDQNAGLRHALILWRKMIQYRIQPSLNCFHLLLDCVRHCSLGDVELLPDLIKEIDELSKIFVRTKVKMETVNNQTKRTVLKLPADGKLWYSTLPRENCEKYLEILNKHTSYLDLREEDSKHSEPKENVLQLESDKSADDTESKKLTLLEESTVPSVAEDSKSQEKLPDESFTQNKFELPNLIAFEPTLGCIVNFKALTKPQHRFLLLGGVKGFLKTMLNFGVIPTPKTFCQLLFLVPEKKEAYDEILNLAKAFDIELDTQFFNALMKMRIFMGEDFNHAQKYLQMMQERNLQPDLITFGTLALACVNLKYALQLVKAVDSFGFRLNGPMVNTMLRTAVFAGDLEYVKGILDMVKEHEVQVDGKFVAKLVNFVEKHKHLKDAKDLENKLYTYATT